jgi:hypothetical protein
MSTENSNPNSSKRPAGRPLSQLIQEDEGEKSYANRRYKRPDLSAQFASSQIISQSSTSIIFLNVNHSK